MVVEYTNWDFHPYFSPSSIPTLPLLSLTDDEKALITRMQGGARILSLFNMELTRAYYHGMQVIENLEIAIPTEIADLLRTLVGWPRIAVDPYVERHAIDGFRLAGATDVDQDLQDLADANGFDAELPMAVTDALSMGRAYWTVGSPDSPGDAPRICAESPLNMSVMWDLNGTRAKTALQGYWVDDVRHQALYLPDQTIHVAQDDSREWVIVNRDMHGFGYVPVVRMANMPETDQRDGYSEITPELMSIVDGACRTLLGLEVSRELYSVPQKLLLGASESDFQDANGVAKKAWATYVNMVLALERDEEGNLPTVHEFTPYDPSVFTKLIEMYASQAAGILAATPQDLGLYTQGNPTSAEAASVNEGRRDRRARHQQKVFGVAMVEDMQLGMRFQNNGELPDKFKRMSIDWADVAIRTPSITSDAVTKEIAAGAVPAVSDVVLKRLGYSAVDRARLAQDRTEAEAKAKKQGIVDVLMANAAATKGAADGVNDPNAAVRPGGNVPGGSGGVAKPDPGAAAGGVAAAGPA
jgi:Phage portal protein, SPP1 Gp6-like